MMKVKKDRSGIYTGIAVAILGMVIIALFWKCRYGYAQLDEAFYPTIAYRFLQGDAILYDEWSNTQLSAVLLLPVIKIYMFLSGSTDGIYLFIRYLYTIFKIGISVFVYLKLKKYGKIEAYITALLFLIFASYGLMVLSYNTIAWGGALLSFLLLMNEKADRRADICCVLSGVTLSISVLGIPYMAILYILYFSAVFITNLFRKNRYVLKDKVYCFYSWRSFIGMTIGIGVSVICFCGYVFSHTTLEQIIQTIPHILYGDPAHPAKTLYAMTLAYLVRIVLGNYHNYIVFIIYALMGICLLFYIFDKKKEGQKSKCVIVECILTMALVVAYILTDNYINSIIFTPNVLAFIFAIMFNKNIVVKKMFYCIWIPGIVVTYLEYLASNTGFSGISAASCIASVASVMIILTVGNEYRNESTVILELSRFIICGMILVCFFYRMTYVFWEDGGFSSLTETITDGVAKGLIVTEEKYHDYYSVYQDTVQIRVMDAETKVLYVADQVLWMSGKQRCASYSPLCYSIATDRSILYDYYKEHPDKMPDIVYVGQVYGKGVVQDISHVLGYKYTKEETGWILQPEE